MPRNEYYQDVGNPLQADRLPLTRPLIALSHLPIDPLEALKSFCGIFALLEVVLIAAVSFIYLDGPARAQQLGSIYIYVLLAAVLALVSWTWFRQVFGTIFTTYLISDLLLLATGSATLQLCAAALATSLFAWHFARHWAAVCTVSPLQRATAAQLHATWRLPIALLAFGPAGLLILGVVFSWEHLALLILVLFSGLLLITAKPDDAPSKLRVLSESFHSWFTYNPDELSRPGLFQAPLRTPLSRITITAVTVAVVAAATIRFAQFPVALISGAAVWSWSSLGWLLIFNLLQLIAAIGIPVLLMLPILVEASRWRRLDVQADNWQSLVHDIQHSPDAIERRSYYMGKVVDDGSPLIVPRQVFSEHAHFLGDAGSGKTSRGLAPWIEQTISFGDCSVVVVDLKADTLELLATVRAAAEQLYRRTGRRIPIKYFTNQSHLSTYTFNPLTQPYWDDFDPYIKTDILCGAAGLLYGSDYGAGWFSAANAAVLHHAIKAFPDVRTFRELAERVNYTVTSAKKRDLHSELRNAGVHVQAVLDRLGSFDALNVAPGTGHPEALHEHAIDLADIFQRPQILYFHLSSTLAAGSSPEIARLLVYSLLCASTQTTRRNQVFLVIDEFQRMVAHNVESMLQQARSMGVGVILANQSLQDLGKLIPSVEANCRYRQSFSVSSLDDRERIVRGSGETVEKFISYTTGTNANGDTTTSSTESEQIRTRLSHNDVQLASDHPLQSIVNIARGAGYAQFGGLPFIVESGYHISKAEYQRRQAMPWPELVPGTFIPRDHRRQAPAAPPKRTSGPILKTEVIGDFVIGSPLPPPPVRKEPRPPKSEGSKQ